MRSRESVKRRADEDDDLVYTDLLYQDDVEEKRLEEQRKRRREKLAQHPVEYSSPARSATSPEPAKETKVDTMKEKRHLEAEIEPDDIEDMFALDNDSAWKVPDSTLTEGRETDVTGPDKSTLERHAPVSGVGLHDNWDDPDGYYRVILGEKLDQRYQVYSILGRGIFATVVRAKDLKQNGRNVAIKIARRQETMFKAGMKEIGILKLLAEADPEDKMFVVRLENHFEHRGHLCMVFESLSLNLREIVKRFGKDVGLHMQAVKTYAKQMFMALVLLRKENIIHADIKPDNILVNEAKTVAKLADLGSASRTTEMEITPYLVSRFYRAPEISM